MSENLEDRKPTLNFNYEGFSTGEQNKVEDAKSSVKQRKLYNCIYMAKKSNKFIRLPVHLACKTCPRGQVDCYIELTTEYPKGDLQRRCATCMSSHCAFTKMDQYVRAELRTWLDGEIRKRGLMAGAGPRAEADVIDAIIEVDGPVAAASGTGTGGRAKRMRPDYVDSGSESDENDIVLRPTNNRARVIAAGPSASVLNAESREVANDSDFVKQAIKLVTSSHTVDKQLAEMQKKIDTEIEARVKAEDAERIVTETLTTSLMDLEEVERKRKGLQQELDGIRGDIGAEKEALDRAVRRQSMSEDTANRIRSEREELREELDNVKGDLDIVKGKVDGLEAALAKEKRDLLKEKEEHDKTTSQLVKWKATFAALQGGI